MLPCSRHCFCAMQYSQRTHTQRANNLQHLHCTVQTTDRLSWWLCTQGSGVCVCPCVSVCVCLCACCCCCCCCCSLLLLSTQLLTFLSLAVNPHRVRFQTYTTRHLPAPHRADVRAANLASSVATLLLTIFTLGCSGAAANPHTVTTTTQDAHVHSV